MKRLVVIFIIFNSFAIAKPLEFNQYLKLFNYPQVINTISDLEKKLFNELPKNKRLINYYIIASGVKTRAKFMIYKKQYKNLLTKVKIKIGKYRNINTYQKAELALHVLHQNLFKKVLTGPDSGDNVGITESFDSGVYNCYMSALIYNSILNDIGIKNTGYLLFKGHLNSVINLKNKAIEVETTNRYGFDPDRRGLPEFKLKFNPQNIKIIDRYYRGKKESNLYTVHHIYNNRALIYAGKFGHTRFKPKKDVFRSAALALFGNFITQNKNEEMVDLLINRLLDITEKQLKTNKSAIFNESKRFADILKAEQIKGYAAKHYRNWNAVIYNIIIDSLRDLQEDLNQLSKQDLIQKIVDKMNTIENAILENISLKEKLFKNLMIYGDQFLKQKLTIKTILEIKTYGLWVKKIVDSSVVKKHPDLAWIKNNIYRNIAVKFYNKGIDEKNSNQKKKALKILKDALDYLNKQLEFNKGNILNKIKNQISELK